MIGRLQRLGVLAAAGLVLVGCGDRRAPAPAPAAVSGERFQVRQQTIPDVKPVAGTITTRDMADARARIGGTLVRLTVKAGDMVRRGQLIGMVVDPRIGFQTSAFDAQVSAAQAEAARAQADLVRTQDLYDHGVYAKTRLEQVQAAARAASGMLNAARAQRAASAAGGAEGAILAPADGKVLRADVPAGSVVSPGQSIATITAGPTVLRVEIPEGQASGLRVGQAVALDPQDLGAGVSSAVISQVYPSVTAGQVTADLTAPGLPEGLVGQRVRVRMPAGERPALTAPTRFIVTRFGMDYADVLARDGAVSEVPVQIAPGPAPDQVEVLSGLAAGDVLVRPGAGR